MQLFGSTIKKKENSSEKRRGSDSDQNFIQNPEEKIGKNCGAQEKKGKRKLQTHYLLYVNIARLLNFYL